MASRTPGEHSTTELPVPVAVVAGGVFWFFVGWGCCYGGGVVAFGVFFIEQQPHRGFCAHYICPKTHMSQDFEIPPH